MYIVRLDGLSIHVVPMKNAVHLRLSYRNGEDHFRLTVPVRCPKRDMEKFLIDHRDWMRAQLQKQDGTAPYQPRLIAGERAWLLGKQVTMGQNGIPTGTAFLELRNQLLHDEIVRVLPDCQARVGRKARRIRWRAMTSRWGSCNIKTGDITLNTRLGAMPPALIEHVLIHELCHLIEANHSPAFYAEMTRTLPDWKERKRQLDHFGPLILPPEEETPCNC